MSIQHLPSELSSLKIYSTRPPATFPASLKDYITVIKVTPDRKGLAGLSRPSSVRALCGSVRFPVSWVRELPGLPWGGHSRIQQFSPPGSLRRYSSRVVPPSAVSHYRQAHPLSEACCFPPLQRHLLKPLSCPSLPFTQPVLRLRDCRVTLGASLYHILLASFFMCEHRTAVEAS